MPGVGGAWGEDWRRVASRSGVVRESNRGVGLGVFGLEAMADMVVAAKFIIEHRRILTENANKPHGHGRIDPASFSPFPKNPVIARVFKEIGLADELGSGVRNLYRYGTAYWGREPELLEDDIFRMIVAVPEDEEESSDSPPSPEKSSEVSSEKSSEKTSEKILRAMRADAGITIAELSATIGVTQRTIERNIKNL